MPESPKTIRYRKTVRAPSRGPNSHQRGYTRRWREASALWLNEQFSQGNVRCAACGKVLDGQRRDVHVDHIEPHRGDAEKFWQPENWQALCVSCHGRKSRAEQGQ